MRKIYFFLLLLGALQPAYSQANYCVKDISVTNSTISIFTTNGEVYTWGVNEYGQVGTGSTQLQSTPYLRPVTPNFGSIYHSLSHTLGLTDDGKIYGWGRNTRGQIGNGTITDVYTPVQIGSDTDWKKMAAGLAHTIALKNNGTLWGWGNNSACELNITSPNPYPNQYFSQPVQISTDNNWIDIAAGGSRTFAIKSNGTLWARGRNILNSLGLQYGENVCVTNLSQVGTDTNWKKVLTSSYGDFTLALKTNNTLWGWGDNITGGVGNGTSVLVQTPVQIGTDTWKEIATGQTYSVGVKSDGTLWQWGEGCWNSTSNVIVPTSSLSPVQVGNDFDWEKVYAGHCVSIAQKSDGSVWAWGGYGYIWNNGAATSSAQPLLIFQCPRASTSESAYELSDIILYPNPAFDQISWAQNISIEKVTIYDMSGKLVLSQSVYGKSVNISSLTTGTYLIKLESKEKLIYNSKFLKK